MVSLVRRLFLRGGIAIACLTAAPAGMSSTAAFTDAGAREVPSAAQSQDVIAVAFPADAQPGDTITGTVTADPKEIDEIQQIPGLHVTLYPVAHAAETPAHPVGETGPPADLPHRM